MMIDMHIHAHNACASCMARHSIVTALQGETTHVIALALLIHFSGPSVFPAASAQSWTWCPSKEIRMLDGLYTHQLRI